MKHISLAYKTLAVAGLVLIALGVWTVNPASAEDFTIVVLPDTQKYSASYPATFAAQTQWIVDNKDALNIVYVAHEGDIVDTASSTDQWDNADAAMSLLEDPVETGLPNGIPYGVVPGNHDEPTTNYNAYFGVSRFCDTYPTDCRSYYGDGYPSGFNDNNYTLFSTSGMDFIVINLAKDPTDDELAWADARLSEFSDRRGIVVSHYILDTDGTFGGRGQQTYDALKGNPNLFLMLCGHMHGEAMRVEEYDGNTVYILLADYQDEPNGGNGWLRIMEFSPANDEITVTTYSPTLDEYGTDMTMGDDTTSEIFTLDYDMGSSWSCTTVQSRVAQSSDDAEERSGGVMESLTSSDLELIHDDSSGVDQLVGMRFQNVAVPQGVTIQSAYIEFETDETSSGVTSLAFYGQAADDPPTFAATSENISSRSKTSASVAWAPGAWDAPDVKHQTKDLSMIVQEIVDRGGWASGNAMVFIVEGSGRRVAESYDGEEENAPLLVIEYCEGTPPPAPTTVTFQQGVDGYSGTVDTYLRSASADADNSGATTLVVDLDEERHILLRFNSILGTDADKIPPGSTIQSASLEINVTNSSDAGALLHRMLQSWNDTDTWNTWGGGVQADGTEAEVAAESSSVGSATGTHTIDVTADLQAWSNDPTGNFGWAWLPPTVDDSWQFDSAEGGTPPKLTVAYTSTGTEALWTAYNDCVYDSTKLEAATDPNGQLVHYIAPNVTTFSTGTDSPGPASGELLDFNTGAGTGITATLTQSGGVVWQPDISSSWTGGYDTAVGTEARDTFGGIADMTGVIYYGSSGWYVDLEFTELDPAKTYTFATSASRARKNTDGSGTGYDDRNTMYTISGADDAINTSTPGVTVISNESVWFNTGNNHDEGYVARWTGIEPGADGSFMVRAEAHDVPTEYKGYSFDVFMLQEVGESTEENLTIDSVGNGSVIKDPDQAEYNPGDVVELTAVPDTGWQFIGWSGDLTGTTNPETVTVTAGMAITANFAPENWTAYVDLRAEAGDSNDPNVLAIVPTGPDTQPIDPAVDWVLKDFDTGADLPATMAVDMEVRYPTTNGADSAAGTDADLIFGGIVDGVGGYEIDTATPGDYVTLTFESLNPAKEYSVAVTYNRDDTGYTDRATMFTIADADDYTNASSTDPPPGVVVNGPDSVSFCTGNNTANGYVAIWTGVTAADGSFSVTAVQDTSAAQGWTGSKGYAMTSIMLQEADVPLPPPSTGDVIISGVQSWNHPGADNPDGEFIELFNTTDQTISLENMEIISRVDNNSDGLLDIDWQLSADLTGKSIAPNSFFLIAEPNVDAENATHDIGTDMDIATGEGGFEERAISIELIIDGVHMDYVLYGRHDGSTPAGELPPGDRAFDGSSWPRTEVVRNTQVSTSFLEGLIRRESATDLYAGYDVEGYYTDEDSLGDGFPNGVWTSPHDEENDAYQARNSTSAAVLPPGPSPCYTLTLGHTGQGTDPVAAPANSSGCPAGEYLEGESIDLSNAVPDAGWEIDSWTGTDDDASTADTNTLTMPASAHSADVNYVELPPPPSPGDVIISGFQAWNSPSGQNPGEFVELFNTTDQTISLENMELISRVDPDGSGAAGVGIDWQLSADLTGKSIAPNSFFLIAESGVAAPSGTHDIETDMDLATGEGGSAERAIALELVIDGVHMDYVLYGRHDGSDGDNPDGDISFDGNSWPRTEVVRNTRGTDSFQEGLARRESAEDLYAGYDVEGYYTDEDTLGDGYPSGVWSSPHSETFGTYEARNSTSAAVLLPLAAPGDVIISGFQAWNSPSGQNPGEFVELFNTTDQTISLENMELISRVDPDGSGAAGVGIDWQLSADLTGKSIAPNSFFLIAESGVAAPSGTHDIETDMDLATGEGGSAERAIALELVIDGVHMDYVLYGRHDGSDGDNPDGDISFDGNSWPRTEVVRNTRGTDSFQEGLARRESAEDLYAGYDVEGYYTDEDTLGDGYPSGVWSSPHSETFGTYEARNSTSPAVLPPGPSPCYALTLGHTGNGTDPVAAPANSAGCSAGEYVEGEVVNLSGAVPDAGWEIDSWTGTDDDGSTADTNTVSMPASAHSVDVNYALITPPENWTAYNDLDPRVPSGSTDNAPNVTEYDYTATDALLKDFATGADLPVTMSGSYNNRDPHANGDNADVGDAADVFGSSSSRIVDMRAMSELDATDWYNTVTFNNLNPEKEYIITLSANRNNYPDARYTRVTIEGADTFTNASSAGVVVNSEASVSFSTGDNSAGYVAKWTGVTVADGSLSIKSEWDSSLGSGADNTKGYAMSVFRLEEVDAPPPTIPDPPTALTATAASSSQIDLAWTDNSDNEMGFEVWSSDSAGIPVALLDTVGANTTVYPDTGLLAETEYCYLVRAVNGAGESAYTNHDCDTTPAPSAPPAGVAETFDTGFTLGQTVGTHSDWFDNGGGPVVTDVNGCGGSPGLAPAGNIFIWTADDHEFDWNDPDFAGIRLGMDFQTDGNGSNDYFDDDRLGWMITESEVGSTNIFGVQLDDVNGGIVTYWRDSSDTRIQDPIVDLTGLLSANTWYRFRAEITKLTDTSAKIDVSLVELDDNCNPVGTPITGTVEDTSQWDDGTGAPGDRAPGTKYFTGPIWPAFKNYSDVGGAADNAYVEILKRFAFVVVTDPHTSDGYAAVRDNLQQIKSWIDSPTEDMPAPEFMVITGDFPDVWQDGDTDPNETDYIIEDVLGEDFLWYPVIGNHEISDDINNFYYIRDTMVPSLPHIVDYGPIGSTNTTYSWDYGNAHFVAINAYWDGTTNPDADHNRDGDIVPELLAWVDADLSVGEENPDRPEFAFVHEPAFPDHRHVGDSLDKYPTNRDAFVTTLNDHDVQTLFCGHTHYYEHDVAPEFDLGDLHQVTNGYLRTYDNPTITYVLVHGSSVTYKVYLRPNSSSSFALHEEWTIGAGVPTDPPDAPTDLTATATSSSQIDLIWVDNADNESGFEIEWSDDSGATFSPLTTVSSDTEEYSHNGLIPLEEYCYRVRATNSAGESDYTNEACDTTLPGPATVTFQEGADGYAGTVDTHIMEAEADTAHGDLDSVEWDNDDPSGTGQYKYALLRFDDLFGSGPGQIPVGATIQSATLDYVVYNTGDPADVHEVTVDWAEDVTYDAFGGEAGVQADEYGASLGSASGSSTGVQSVDVTASLAAWSSDPSANRGWIFLPTDTDGVDFRSSEYTTSAQRPILTVEYNAPCTQNSDCDDGNPCNGLETCDVGTGICQAGTPVDCPPGTTCNPDNGECEAGPITLMFQEGEGGYSGTYDTFLQEDAPDNVNGSLDEWEWDDDDPNDSNNRNFGLIRFDNIFGSGTDQIPQGAEIVSAIFTYTVFDEGVTGDVREMLTDWDESDNLTSLCDGSCDEGIEYGTTSIGSATAPSAGTYDVDVTSSVQSWAFDPDSNKGWIVVPPSPPGESGGGAQVRSSEYTDTPSQRPKLTVVYEWADSPYPPTVVSPTDGEEGIPLAPHLMVNVTDPDDDTMDVTFFGREVGAGTAENFTIIVLPDTQYYSQSYPQTFVDQTDWIVDNREALNIVQVIHVGDVVQNAGEVPEWQNADAAMSLLEDPVTTLLVDGIPYGISPGNHDQNMTNFNNYFGESRFTGRAYYGGHYSGSGNENSFSLFSGGGMDFIVIYLNWESSSNADILDWADGLLTTYSHRRAIVASHYLMGVGEPGSFSSQGQAIYNALKDHSNLFLMVSGHIHGEGIRMDDIDPPDPDHKIHTILADYQDLPNGGNGWLRIMGFSPEVDEITVTTYSPTLGQYGTDTAMGDDTTSAQFSLDYDMEGSGPFTELGTVYDVPSGSDASLPWPGPDLTSRTTYEWYVDVTDGTSTTTGQVWSFITACSSDGECDDNNLCTTDTCNSGTGVCENVPIDCPEGEMCDPDSGACVPEPTAVTFQEGVNAYSGTHDTFLQEDAPANVNGSLDEWEWDDDDPNGSNNRNYGLIRFDDIFGSGADQIPEGSQIVSAILTYTVFDEGVTGDVREMLTDWDESDNLTSVCDGSCDEGIEYGTLSIGSAPASSAGTYDVDVTSSVQAWAIDPPSNMGWIIVPPSPPGDAGGGAQVRSSEYASTALRPKLTVDHVLPIEVPEAPTGLSATALSGTEVGLVWADNSNNETSFEVERSTDGGPFSLLAVVRANSESYADTELNPETDYCYRVRSNNIIGASAYTDPACATTPATAFEDDFEAYGAGADPDDWLDTGADNSLTEDDLFQVFDLSGNKVFGTTSTLTNIHSHYVGAGSDGFSDYEYTGRMMINASSGGTGVTFFSQYPSSDTYYRLRRYPGSDFHLSWHGTTITGDTSTGVVPVAGTWYRFRIQVEVTATQTDIRAMVWVDGSDEPDWQAQGYDDSATRLTSGTIGVWSMGPGSSYWDDLKVEMLGPPPSQYDLTVNTAGAGSGTVTLAPPGGTYDDGTVVTLTANADPGSDFTGWSDDLTGDVNPTTITMDTNKTVTATFEPVPTYDLTVNTAGLGSGTVTLDPPGGTYSVDTVVTLTANADTGSQFT
ncbi:MAG: DNRLRE domain-containing protein, partial [Thermodesulfobacteriota bacterium]|nr:DNRLRE domain-containing protein [Thermodesulfobacteriota bacterium]